MCVVAALPDAVQLADRELEFLFKVCVLCLIRSCVKLLLVGCVLILPPVYGRYTNPQHLVFVELQIESFLFFILGQFVTVLPYPILPSVLFCLLCHFAVSLIWLYLVFWFCLGYLFCPILFIITSSIISIIFHLLLILFIML